MTRIPRLLQSLQGLNLRPLDIVPTRAKTLPATKVQQDWSAVEGRRAHQVASRLIIALTLLVGLLWCAALVDVDLVSVADTHSPEIKNKTDGTRIDLEGIVLLVKPLNAKPIRRDAVLYAFPVPPVKIGGKITEPDSTAAPTDVFVVQIELRPLSTGMTLDPSRVTLTTERGETKRPTRSREYEVNRSAILDFHTLCEEEGGVEIEAGERIELQSGSKHCVALFFATGPPSPESAFTVQIDGLLAQEGPIRVPALDYRKAKKKSRIVDS